MDLKFSQKNHEFSWDHFGAVSISKSQLDVIFSKKMHANTNYQERREAFIDWKKVADRGLASAQYRDYSSRSFL